MLLMFKCTGAGRESVTKRLWSNINTASSCYSAGMNTYGWAGCRAFLWSCLSFLWHPSHQKSSAGREITRQINLFRQSLWRCLCWIIHSEAPRIQMKSLLAPFFLRTLSALSWKRLSCVIIPTVTWGGSWRGPLGYETRTMGWIWPNCANLKNNESNHL